MSIQFIGVANSATTPVVAWRFPVEGWGRVAVDERTVFALSRRHDLIAVDRRTGALRWRTPLSARGAAGAIPMGSAVVLTTSAVIAGNYDLFAVDPVTGAFRWRFSPEKGYGPGVYVGAADQHTIYTGSPAGYVYAVDVGTGALRWSLSIGEVAPTNVYPPAVDGDLVVAGFSVFETPARGGLIAVDARTGIKRWKIDFSEIAPDIPDQTWAGGPVTWRNHVIAVSSTGVVYGFHRNNGQLAFAIPSATTASPSGARDFRPLTVVGDTLLAGSLSGQVTAYELPARRERWRSAGDRGSVAFGMTADTGSLYVPYGGGRIVAIDVRTGQERWSTDAKQGAFNWVPTVADGFVYAAAADALTAFRR